jgi:ppGpp synthetase/RelA/SpoT-type nucleotidyltranferase
VTNSGGSYAELIDDYEAVRPLYGELADVMKELLEAALVEAGFDETVQVTARAKDLDSFGKKAVRKGYTDPLVQIEDKAGVRVVVAFARHAPEVERLAETLFELDNRDDKREQLSAEELGYLGIHYRTKVRPEHLSDREHLIGLQAEMQIQTKAENAWAVASHDSLYKACINVPPPVARTMMRLVALVELFDGEVARFEDQLHQQPGYRELQAVVPPLESEMLKFTRRRADRGLSALVVPPIVALYETDPERVYPDVLQPYVETERDNLAEFFAAYEGDTRAHPLLFQPEALMIFERLAADRYQLKRAWPTTLPETLLDDLAAIRGVKLG